MSRVLLYDTTLRDGCQAAGISLSLQDKLKIARRLDELGFDYIEGGWPGSNPKDAQFFEAIQQVALRHARVTAFGSTRRAGVRPEQDANLRLLIDAGTPAVALVAKSWDFHVREVLRVSLEENLAMIADSVGYLKTCGREVIYDAEHFFDGYRANPDYALATLRAAAGAGADWLVLCDTNGGSLPDDVAALTAAMVAEFGPIIGVHTHNDGELAVANALAAVRAGARQVQGTINGYGERTGNCNLCSIVPNLALKMGLDCAAAAHLGRLTELSRYVDEVANQTPNRRLPFVGAASFSHKGGIHVHAIMAHPSTYEHIDPVLVGNERHILISELSGRSNVLERAQQRGLPIAKDSPAVRAVVQRIKELEAQGFQFEDAEASFELLVRRAADDYRPPFELLDFVVLSEKRGEADILAEATVKLRVGGEVLHTAAEGNGPVNALDAAMRKALLPVYPRLAEVTLTDYKVRVLETDAGTAAAVRVGIQTTGADGATWMTVGSSANVLQASWYALADSLEYALVTWRDALVTVRHEVVAAPATSGG
ncbi:MAG: citramalate synthase [Chloroflexi bacterium]|nr:citramalate synthase [Chloroflexota bacterium]